mmetsp:Transcript_115580/g.201142  ORF Transcript_115580/g.201142 Transcript_115580/m.201142 type:complete len:244 (+) Transcript_115580:544-1275(+)
MGTWKAMEIGGRDHCCWAELVLLISCTSALKRNSDPPGKRRILHTMDRCSASYLALPVLMLILQLAVLFGVGTLMTTLVPNKRELNSALIRKSISRRVFPNSLSTGDSTRNGGLTLSCVRYFIRINSPSGGTKLIVRSASNFPNRTHWWKVISSKSISEFFLFDCFSFSNMLLSLSPNLHSGIPDKKLFITTLPATSRWRMFPCWDINKFTSSTTSINTSFFRCLIPSLRQLIFPVTFMEISD